jgi:S-adenosyl-L-methionine hydrolase (adenosine-forming)
MSFITLISDWSKDDYYTAAVKGQVYQSFPDARFIDINHNIHPFDIQETAFVLRNTWKNFPEGTVHIVAVDSEWHNDYPHVIVKYNKQYFVGTDNGIFGLAFDEKPEKTIKIDKDLPDVQTFPSMFVFARVAAQLLKGSKPDDFGSALENVYYRPQIMPITDKDTIEGSIIFIDSYQNVITNISKKTFDETGKGRKFEILVQSNHYRINKINTRYNETSNGELLALFNSAGLLEVAMAKARLAEIMSLKKMSSIRVKFYEL